jgi:protoporphyrinogen oxidase
MDCSASQQGEGCAADERPAAKYPMSLNSNAASGKTTPEKTALIIGAGPAGLTAALEFLKQSDIKPIVLEASREIGGLSRTVRYKGNRMDIGGHRFFSKSDRVMEWWLEQMPVEMPDAEPAATIRYRGQSRVVAGMGARAERAAAERDLVMLVRPRRSRIYFLRRFFEYPITLTIDTLSKLGLMRAIRIGVSYMASRAARVKPEKSLEDFLINRFGRQLYLTFFKSYTEKVWGTECKEIPAAWGAQRIKGLSLARAVKHFLKRSLGRREVDVAQKRTDTSLIERFLYPKFGPGQLWEHVAEKVVKAGGEIHTGWKAVRVDTEGNRVIAVDAVSEEGVTRRFEAGFFLSSMPMRELVNAMEAGGTAIAANVKQVSDGLVYRDFIVIGILTDSLLVTEPDGGLLKDTWIYIQEPDVQIGRLQIFNNWSPYLVEPGKVWIGLEYFCNDTDPLWKMADEELTGFGAAELEKIGILRAGDVLDSHVVRAPKTYPAYFGTYDRFDELRAFVDSFENLFLIGRNGMHKYNNQDHSMLTAMQAVENVVRGKTGKDNLWSINTEQDYHEQKLGARANGEGR